MAIELITTAGSIQCLPTGAAGVSVTPSNSAWANSAYAQVVASAAADLVLLGVVAVPATNADFEVDVATGADGAETVIATLTGCDQEGPNYGSSGPIPLSIPVDNIASGARIAVRMRKAGTNTTAWQVSLQVASKPLGATITTTTNPSLVYPPAAASKTTANSGTPWTASAWTEVVASAADALVLGGVACGTPGTNGAAATEVDVGVGAAGAEVVLTTVRFGADRAAPCYFPLRPLLDAIPASSRIAVRTRSSWNSGTNYIRLLYYNKTNLGTVTNLLTTKPMKWLPSGAAATQVPQSSTNWVSGAWTQFSASLAANSQIVALQCGTAVGAQREIDLGIGGAGAEAVQATVRLAYGSGGQSSNHEAVFSWPLDLFAAGGRLALRTRGIGNNTTGLLIAVGYYEADDSGLKSATATNTLPAAAGSVSITPNGTAWANSNWTELTSGIGSQIEILDLQWNYGVQPIEFEFDVGTGGAGSETVVLTTRGFIENYCYDSGVHRLTFFTPYAIPANTRVAVRMRKAGTNTTAWTIGATYSTATAAPPASSYVFPALTLAP
jgi:hypothetical protein